MKRRLKADGHSRRSFDGVHAGRRPPPRRQHPLRRGADRQRRSPFDPYPRRTDRGPQRPAAPLAAALDLPATARHRPPPLMRASASHQVSRRACGCRCAWSGGGACAPRCAHVQDPGGLRHQVALPFSSISGWPRPLCFVPPPVLLELLDQCAANLAQAARWHPMGLAMGGTSTPDQRGGFPGRDEQTRLSTRSPRTRMRRVLLSLEASQHEPAADREHGEHGGHDRAFGGA